MRRARLLTRGQEAVYHCMSRIVAGQFLLRDTEREVLRQRMIKLAQFCQVQIQTHCSLSNHFHIVLKVPAKVRLTDQQLLKALKSFYGPKDPRPAQFAQAKADPKSPLLENLRTKYLARMGDLSVFMKELKEFFSKWYNARNDRFGTLWAERFKSVLIANFWEVILLVAAYVDLNALRAGLVKDPKDYRFCGYAEALARDGPARQGLASFLPGKTWQEKSAFYRQALYCKGQWARKENQACVDAQEALKVYEAGGKLGRAELLRLKVRYFTEAIALGTPQFVEEVFRKHWKGHCVKRTRAGCPLQGADWKGWLTLRHIRQPVELPKSQQ